MIAIGLIGDYNPAVVAHQAADHAETAPGSSRTVIVMVEVTNTIRLRAGTRLSRAYGREEMVAAFVEACSREARDRA